MPIENDRKIRALLETARTIAVVGASNKPWRDSNTIASFLIEQGYAVFPVNPNYQEILGLPCYPDLAAIPDPVDIVDVFRTPEAVPQIVEEAISIKAKALWLQLGVIHEDAARKAEEHGLQVVMDHCILVDYRRLMN